MRAVNSRRACSTLNGESATRHLISCARRLATAPFHDAVEGSEVSPSLTVLKKMRRLQCRNLFRHSGGDELVDAGSFFLADALDSILE
jgi:hypothetical protein